jgi:hypothetical protein
MKRSMFMSGFGSAISPQWGSFIDPFSKYSSRLSGRFEPTSGKELWPRPQRRPLERRQQTGPILVDGPASLAPIHKLDAVISIPRFGMVTYASF